MNISAQDILDSKVFKKAVEGAQQRIKDEWAREASQQTREALWHRLQATESLTRELRAIAGSELVAQRKQ